MDIEEQKHKQFLEKQLEFSKEQDFILVEIEIKLHAMKSIAQYALDHELSEIEANQLDIELNKLKREVHILEHQLQSVVY